MNQEKREATMMSMSLLLLVCAVVRLVKKNDVFFC